MMISDVRHLFMYLLATWMSSLEKCLLSSSVFFSLNCFVVVVVVGLFEFLCIVDINTLSDIAAVVHLLSLVQLFCDPHGL